MFQGFPEWIIYTLMIALALIFVWYSGCLKATSDNGLNVGKNEIDSGEELLLEYSMNMLHWKKNGTVKIG